MDDDDLGLRTQTEHSDDENGRRQGLAGDDADDTPLVLTGIRRFVYGARKSTGGKAPQGTAESPTTLTPASTGEQFDQTTGSTRQPTRRGNFARRSRGALLPVVSQRSYTEPESRARSESPTAVSDEGSEGPTALTQEEARALQVERPVAGTPVMPGLTY